MINFLFLITAFVQVKAQESSKLPRVTKADSLFQQRDYSAALPLYKELLRNFPQDASYMYKTGVCVLYSTRNSNEAIGLLKRASELETPNLTYFYLAEAYRFSYRFDEAIDMYRRFTVSGGDETITPVQVEFLVNQCENGNYMLKYLYRPPVLESKTIAQSDMVSYLVTDNPTGSFVPKPKDLKTPVDLKQNEQSVIFYPKSPKPGDYIYYASYGRSTQYGKDIFRIQLQDDGYWSKPENLGDAVNSSLDEDFPYFAPDGTLYFASKGHYSMGGYDVYRSRYDATTKTWSTPENLGFPFSSPYNDIYYLPLSNDTLAYLITNRNVGADSLEIVLVKEERSQIRQTASSFDEIIAVAKLGVSTNLKSSKEKTTPVASKPAPTKAASFSSVENDPEYVRVMASGFKQQMLADSLRISLEKERGTLDYVYTAEQRKAAEARIVKVEDALLAAQKSADTHFACASQIEQEYLTGKRKPQEKSNASFASDNPKYVYQAQFASTVFQSDEIATLANLEKQTPRLDELRKAVFAQQQKLNSMLQSKGDSTANYKQEQGTLISLMNEFNQAAQKWVTGKEQIYSLCLPVALVKSGNNNGSQARAEIERGKNHFRSAAAIKNNLTDEGKTESLFESTILEEIGITRYELAFAKLWGITMFEQEVTSRVRKLESDAFGKPLPMPVPNRKEDVAAMTAEAKEHGQSLIVDGNNPVDINSPILFQQNEGATFQVVEDSPYEKGTPIPLDEKLPEGVVYRIQLAAFSNAISPKIFKGMVPVSAETVSKSNVTKYYVGMFRFYADAEKALPIVRSRGFKDAFVVAWHNGKPITPARAQSLEQQPVKPSLAEPKIKITTSEPDKNVLYQVQIGTYKGRLPDDVAQTVRALAPGKDIVRKFDQTGNTTYSVSSFSSLNDATHVKEMLVAGGIADANVITINL
ncbi:MAG: tetratricopeptide repeat protein [Bacteroidales bacterium]|nr:tetratricopeptide repeat protein [Bacteroidales bacterium]MBN2750745.1 tetratricopeptide repeat protein [Bacteroidales bacterium]